MEKQVLEHDEEDHEEDEQEDAERKGKAWIRARALRTACFKSLLRLCSVMTS